MYTVQMVSTAHYYLKAVCPWTALAAGRQEVTHSRDRGGGDEHLTARVQLTSQAGTHVLFISSPSRYSHQKMEGWILARHKP